MVFEPSFDKVGAGHEEQEEGGVSDEDRWGSGRYGWEILWDRPCRLTLRILGITLQLDPHTCAACGYSQVRADWKRRTPLFFTHTHKSGVVLRPSETLLSCALFA